MCSGRAWCAVARVRALAVAPNIVQERVARRKEPLAGRQQDSRPGQQRAGSGASRPWLHALSTYAHTCCGQYIAHAGRGFRRVGEHICAPLKRRQARQRRSANGWRIRVPPPLHLVAVCEGIVHARGAAALTRNLVTWQRGQDGFLTPVRKLLPWERDIARAM